MTTYAGITHKVEIGKYEFYITVGCFGDGRPAFLSCKGQKNGTVLRGMMNAICAMATVAFEMGATVPQVAEALRGEPFEPCGDTNNESIPKAKSVPEYVADLMEREFGKVVA